MTWFAVVHEDHRGKAHPDYQLWTVSKDPAKTGWDTDCGCPGYGLTKAEAEFLALAANEKEWRDGVEGPWEVKRQRQY